jgi:uncharacterized membrane protein YphA (DoxX/SURF4 family)
MTTTLSTPALAGAPTWEQRLFKIALLIGRVGLAYLFFSQLFWKMPPQFGCGDGPFTFTSTNADGQLVRAAGLCDWLGVESVYAQQERSFFVTDFNNDGSPEIGFGLGLPVALNGAFVDNVVIPNIGLFGWLIWLAEAFIAVSLFFGIFSRLGALVSLGISLQLMLGLAGAWDPVADLQEWEWTYHMIVLMSIVMLGLAPGRIWGVDAWLRPRLAAAVAKGSGFARWLLVLT